MSIALESNSNNPIERSGFVHGMSFATIYDSSDSGRPVAGVFTADRRFLAGNSTAAATTTTNVVEDREAELDSCSSSSIGRNSDASSGGDGDSGEGEVQSSYKGPLNTLDALEEVLPIKRGISNFYRGKSKSFTSLADASCSTIRDIAKPENAYTRKRKNLLAYSTYFDKNRNNSLRSNSGGISKRSANSRSTLALAVTMTNSESNNNSESSNSNSSSPTRCLPPLYPQSRRSPSNDSAASSLRHKLSPWRSFSLSDLQCAAAATPRITVSTIGDGDEEETTLTSNLNFSGAL